jgi:Ser/Thr protein kinase RdoA (MazF antagonist)
MGDAAAVRDWPALQTREVDTVLEHWGLSRGDAKVIWHSPRPLSAAAIIELPDGKLFVKRHHRSVRTPPELQEEHRFIQHLRTHDASVSDVLRAARGATAVAIGDWTYEVHHVGAGLDLYRDAVSWSPFLYSEHATAAGRALGLLHASSEGFDAPPRAASLLVSNDRIIRSAEPLSVVEELAEARPAIRDYLRDKNWRIEIARAIAPFHRPLLDLLPRLESLWTHNDWHASNLLWSDASAAANVHMVLDFGLSDRTTAMYDLATAIERNTIPWLDIHKSGAGPANLAQVSGLIRGYLGARPLDPTQRAALPALLPLVHVGYALTEIDYFHGTTRSGENADLAYHRFLLGHCAWFESAQGRTLLEHVQRELVNSS